MAVNHAGVFPWPLTERCMLSGMTAVICTYPLDVVRARLAFQVTGYHHYTGIINAFQTIYLKVMHVFSGTLPSHASHADCFFKLKEDPLGFCFYFSPLKGGGCPGLLQGSHANTYWDGPLCRWIPTYSISWLWSKIVCSQSSFGPIDLTVSAR